MNSASASTFLNLVAGMQSAAGHKHGAKGAGDVFATMLGAQTGDAAATGTVDPALLTLQPAPAPAATKAKILTGLTEGATEGSETAGAANEASTDADGAATKAAAKAGAQTAAVAPLVARAAKAVQTKAGAKAEDDTAEAKPADAAVATQLIPATPVATPVTTPAALTLTAPTQAPAATPEADPAAIDATGAAHGKAAGAQTAGPQTSGAKQSHGGAAPAGHAAAQSGAQVAAQADPAIAAPDIKIDAAASSSTTSTLPDAAATATTTSTTPAGQSAQTAALQGAPPAAIQVYTRMIERLDGRAQRFEVRLDPAELGRVDVRIEVGADKKVHAVLAAHDSAALTDLMRGQRALEQSLRDSGIDVADGGIRFELSSDNGRSLAGNQQQRGQQSDNALAHAWRGFSTAEVAVEPEAAAIVRPQWRPTRLDLVA